MLSNDTIEEPGVSLGNDRNRPVLGGVGACVIAKQVGIDYSFDSRAHLFIAAPGARIL